MPRLRARNALPIKLRGDSGRRETLRDQWPDYRREVICSRLHARAPRGEARGRA